MISLLLLGQLVLSQSFADSRATGCAAGLSAYEATVYPLQRRYCASCHGNGGIAEGHSVANSAQAYVLTRDLVSFADVTQSELMSRIRSRHWIKYDPNQVPIKEGEMADAISAWWEQGERVCPKKDSVRTGAQKISPNLPLASTGKFEPLAWKLNDDCQFKIEIQKFRNADKEIPGSYRLRSPRIQCKTMAAAVKGVWLSVSGDIASFENTYADVAATVAPSGSAEPAPLSLEHAILIERSSGVDTIEVLFDLLVIK